MPPPPADGWPPYAPRAGSGEGGALDAYPAMRRAARLSFQVCALLPQIDRQALLEEPAASARLQAVLELLASVRTRLAAQLKSRRADWEEDDGYPSATG